MPGIDSGTFCFATEPYSASSKCHRSILGCCQRKLVARARVPAELYRGKVKRKGDAAEGMEAEGAHTEAPCDQGPLVSPSHHSKGCPSNAYLPKNPEMQTIITLGNMEELSMVLDLE